MVILYQNPPNTMTSLTMCGSLTIIFSWENFDGFWPKLAYAWILMTSSLGFLSVYFRQFVTGLRPLNDVRISLWLNILRMKDWILTKLCICIDIDDILLDCSFWPTKAQIDVLFFPLALWVTFFPIDHIILRTQKSLGYLRQTYIILAIYWLLKKTDT